MYLLYLLVLVDIKVGTENNDLRQIFKAHPEYINRELVYPLVVDEKPLYLNTKYVNNEEMLAFVHKHLVSIITPATVEALVAQGKDNLIHTLESSYENGRVLEAEEKIMIDGQPYVVTIKGPGSTSYAREEGALNPRAKRDGFTHTQTERELLRHFSFFEFSGVMDIIEAQDAIEASDKLLAAGMDVERILAVYAIDKVMGPDGEYKDVQQLKDDGIINARIEKPVIMLRATKTNIRLLDVYMLYDYEKVGSVKPLLDHIVSEVGDAWGVKTIGEYCVSLVKKVLRQKMTYATIATHFNGEKWFDMGRNITLWAEDMDVAESEFGEKQDNPHDFTTVYSRLILNMSQVLEGFLCVILENHIAEVDPQALADAYYEGIASRVRENMSYLQAQYDQHERHQWFPTFNGFVRNFFIQCFTFSLQYTGRREHCDILRKKLIEKLQLKNY